jgi:hypothetical protein
MGGRNAALIMERFMNDPFITTLTKNYTTYANQITQLDNTIGSLRLLMDTIKNDVGYATHGTDEEKHSIDFHYKKIMAYINQQ